MTLSHPQVMQLLRDHFVCGWRNARQEAYAGTSHRHDPQQDAISVNNGSGHHNVQLLFLTPDGRVVHCLPGFWRPEDFLVEAHLALQLGELWRARLSAAERERRFAALHRRCQERHGQATRAASRLQKFDEWHFLDREWPLDFIRPSTPTCPGGLDTLDQVVHRRLAARPFATFESFDLARFLELGEKHFAYSYGLVRPSRSRSSWCGNE